QEIKESNTGEKRAESFRGDHFEESVKAKNKQSFHWTTGSCALLVIPVTAFLLGCWQIYRLRWKLDLINNLLSRTESEAKPFPYDKYIDSLKDMEYCRLNVEGEFLNDREFLIRPRGRFDKSGLIGNFNISSHGAHIITPFRLRHSGLVILINRGWVPSDKLQTESRRFAQIEGPVSFDAIVRVSENRPQFVSQNRPNEDVWFYKDLDAMAKRYGTAPIFLDACYESTIEGGPIGGQTNISVRNDHLSYLITWFSLSAVTLAMWIVKFRK
ncbi:unnamed protein product, partial [Dracunculus medinensis]|uniref:SURF1-like protein n=1 Tax=Dracunculus medinensis TaxID=318479 RepID=A0A0N4UEA4_DRAME